MDQKLQHIREMLSPWLKPGEDSIYFRVKPLLENTASMGILMSARKDHPDRLVFERSIFHEASRSMYRTINGKTLTELTSRDLDSLEKAVSEYVAKGRVFPAILRDFYSTQISSENDWFTSVDFQRPIDGEMLNASEYIEEQDNTEAVLPDFDAAIYYAEKASLALERRGHVWDEMQDGERIFHVTLESDDPRIMEQAGKYGGRAEVSRENGTTLTMATFQIGRDARRFHDDIHRLLQTDYYKTTPQALLDGWLQRELPKPGMKITLDDPLTLSHRVQYRDQDIRNVKTVQRTPEGFTVANGSRSVPVTDLASYSSRALLNAVKRQEALRAVYERVTGPGRSLTDDQMQRVTDYTAGMDSQKRQEAYDGLLDSLGERFSSRHVPQKWIDQAREELHGLARDIEQHEKAGLRR